jgi:hypothetical protein
MIAADFMGSAGFVAALGGGVTLGGVHAGGGPGGGCIGPGAPGFMISEHNLR